MQRADFPAISDQEIYFDTAATAHKPRCVIDALVDCYSTSYGTVHRALYRRAREMTERYQLVRQKVARFIGAGEQEIVFTKGATEAINLVAASLELKEGDQVLLSEIEHHSNIVPWQIACAKAGATLCVAPVDDRGVLDLELFEELLGERTAVVAIGHISNALGTVHPIKAITEMAHKCGALVVVDGAQAAPHHSIDVADLGCDFYAFSGHKMYGPTGVGVLFGKVDLLEQMAPYQSGGDMIERVSFEGTSFGPPPVKYEAGTPPIAQVIGLGAAIDYLEAIGLDEIGRWEHRLLALATEQMSALPNATIIGTAEEKGAILTYSIDGVHPLDMATLLDLEGVAIRTGHLCAQPALDRFGLPAFARLSFGLYNTEEEVDRFFGALGRVVSKLL